MKLRRFLLRYFPPGLILDFQMPDGSSMTRSVDLLNLTVDSDLSQLAIQVVDKEPILRPRLAQIRSLLTKLQARQEFTPARYELQGTVRAHILPLTSCAFGKNGDCFLTGAHDNTCRLWSASDCSEIVTMSGHTSVVFCVGFNHPFDDRVFTGSFDSSAKVWDCRGTCLSTLQGHEGEVVSLAFEPQWGMLATGALDHTVRLWDVETGRTLGVFDHEGEVSSVSFEAVGNCLLTSSFDHLVRIWDRRTQTTVRVLEGHSAEVATAQFNFLGNRCVSASLDCSARLWDVASGRCEHVFTHSGEVQDACFNASGSALAWAGHTEARVAAVSTLESTALLGHRDEVSKVLFSAQGGRVLTASADCTARVWETQSGLCTQELQGHEDEVFACTFSYEADRILTTSKDNSCNIWRSTS